MLEDVLGELAPLGKIKNEKQRRRKRLNLIVDIMLTKCFGISTVGDLNLFTFSSNFRPEIADKLNMS